MHDILDYTALFLMTIDISIIFIWTMWIILINNLYKTQFHQVKFKIILDDWIYLVCETWLGPDCDCCIFLSTNFRAGRLYDLNRIILQFGFWIIFPDWSFAKLENVSNSNNEKQNSQAHYLHLTERIIHFKYALSVRSSQFNIPL